MPRFDSWCSKSRGKPSFPRLFRSGRVAVGGDFVLREAQSRQAWLHFFGKERGKMKDVLPFEEIDRQSLPLVGGKGANLGEMYRAGLPVPPGFCVTTAAYRRITDELQEMEGWLDELNRLKPDQLDEIRALAQKIR